MANILQSLPFKQRQGGTYGNKNSKVSSIKAGNREKKVSYPGKGGFNHARNVLTGPTTQKRYPYGNKRGNAKTAEPFKSPIGGSKSVLLGGTARNRQAGSAFKNARSFDTKPRRQNIAKRIPRTGGKGPGISTYGKTKPQTRNFNDYRGSGAYGPVRNRKTNPLFNNSAGRGLKQTKQRLGR